MIAEEILTEIDSTLDRLIQNASTFSNAPISELSEPELDAFQKTQESLLNHLLHMDQVYEEKRKSIRLPNSRSCTIKIHEKYEQFEKLKKSVNYTIEKAEKKIPFFTKRKNKRFLSK